MHVTTVTDFHSVGLLAVVVANTFCETVPPTGYQLTPPICRTIDLYWDSGVGTSVLHKKKSRDVRLRVRRA